MPNKRSIKPPWYGKQQKEKPKLYECPEGYHCHCAQVVTYVDPNTGDITLSSHGHVENVWCPNDNCQYRPAFTTRIEFEDGTPVFPEERE